MRLKIGNTVAVIDDVIKGIVSDIKGKTVYVKDQEGMVYQFLETDLVKIDVEQNELTKYTDINSPLLRAKQQPSKQPKKTLFKKRKNDMVMEVDLHIHQLVKSTRGMDNYDMLSLQVDTAKRKLEYCIQKKISKIVFIHGVGDGVLKKELYYLLKRYPVDYYDASYQQYGLGATEVYIYQNL